MSTVLEPAVSVARPATAVRSDHDTALVIDLDGTLIRSDLLHESLLRLLAEAPSTLLAMPRWLAAGKACFKSEVASRVELDFSHLPYDTELLTWLAAERAGGRRVVLCTASDRKLAHGVADHLRLFDEVMASDGTVNLASTRKADALVTRFGAGGFDYAGNSFADVAVWKVARCAIVVNAPAPVRAAAAKVASIEREFVALPVRLSTWVKALRVRQWVKNLLVFLPLLGAHELFDWPKWQLGLWAFLSFSLCASSVYLVNDLADVESDRRHGTKRFRPFAAGLVSVPRGLVAALLLLVTAFVIAARTSTLAFVGWLGVYLVVTVCYTFWLKRKILVDSLVLAGLYTLRVLAGSAAIMVPTGFWLLAFSMFLFISLALVKRYAELSNLMDAGHLGAAGRDYQVEDRHLVQTLGITSGFASVVMVALYINGESVSRLYPHPELLWPAVPVVLYWVNRMWLKAHRREMDDDPIVFALRDGVSLATIAVFFVTLALASIPW